jgi:carboxylesterase
MQDLSKTGILLLHGFAGSRRELTPLQKYLEDRGYIVSTPLLAGHGSTRKNLAASTYQDWIQSAMAAATELKDRCGKLSVVGFSMGGLVAVHICRKINVEKLIFINTPIYFWDVRRIAKNLAGNLPVYANHYFKACIEKPIPALVEFLKILRKTKPLFSDITCPVIIFQTRNDDTVHHRSANFIYRHVKGAAVLQEYHSGGHELFWTNAALHACADIERALKSSIKPDPTFCNLTNRLKPYKIITPGG